MSVEYYIPKLEDLFVGYECEKSTFGEFDTIHDSCSEESYINHILSPEQSTRPHKITGRDLLNFGEWTPLSNVMHGPGFEIAGNIRTKYLDKEGIESLGWTLFKSDFESKKNIQGYEKDNYMLVLLEDRRISILLKDITKDKYASFYSTSTLYLGDCPSINELRRLMKMLHID